MLQRFLSRFAAGIPGVRDLAKGFSGHSSPAWRDLRASIVDHVTKSSPWPETRLVVTGDLSTWGDDVSIQQGLGYAARIAAEARLQEPIVIYGNHDVWPGYAGVPVGFPLFAVTDLGQRRTAMRAQYFRGVAWPRHPLLQVALPNGRNLVVFALNTIEHQRFVNTVASGHVRADGYWQAPSGPQQLAALTGMCGPTDVGIALTHHPVHDDGKWTAINQRVQPQMPAGFPALHQLTNAPAVAAALAGPPQRAHAVLSGHTHETSPKVGDSNGARPAPPHQPLVANQVQLTAGTSMQAQFGPRPKPQAWQCVRFYCDRAATRLRVERIVFVRTNNLPGFSPASADPNDPQAVADVWELTL
jgi:hypothetical protein